jgi:hypothetical protein
VTDARLRLELVPGTRRFRTIGLDVQAEGVGALLITSSALGPSIAMPGLGYSGGFDDGNGLGVWRGELHVEHERWDVSHPADVVDANGNTTRPWHRIQPVHVQVEGAGFDSEGTGSMTAIPSGHLPQYGLPAR